MAKKTDMPQLKPIGSVVGIGGKTLIRDYLTSVFNEIGFEQYTPTFAAFANFRGVVGEKQMEIAISILKKTLYVGLNTDNFIRYRTFQGLRLQVRVKLKTQTRLTIAKKAQNKLWLLISNFIIKFKTFKLIDNDYLNKTVISPDEIFSKAFVSDLKIKNILNELSQTDNLSWGIVIIPEKLDIGFTYKNLDSLDAEMLRERLNNIAKLVGFIDQKPISKPLDLTKHELLARDNPKALAWRFILYLLIFMLVGTGLLIAILFGLAKLIGLI